MPAGKEGSSSAAHSDWFSVQARGRSTRSSKAMRRRAEVDDLGGRSRGLDELAAHPVVLAHLSGMDLCVLSHHGLRADLPHAHTATTGRVTSCSSPFSSARCRHRGPAAARQAPGVRRRPRSRGHLQAGRPPVQQLRSRRGPPGGGTAAAPNSTSPRRDGLLGDQRSADVAGCDVLVDRVGLDVLVEVRRHSGRAGRPARCPPRSCATAPSWTPRRRRGVPSPRPAGGG